MILVGDPYKPLFATLTGREPHPKYIQWSVEKHSSHMYLEVSNPNAIELLRLLDKVHRLLDAEKMPGLENAKDLPYPYHPWSTIHVGKYTLDFGKNMVKDFQGCKLSNLGEV